MNVPQLRFSGFDGEWEVKKLSEIAKISSGGTPNRKKKEYWNGNIPWITTSEVKFNNIFKAKEYITEVGLRESSAKLFPLNTILIAMYGQGQTRGKSAVLKIEAATNQACAAIKVEEAYDPQLIYQVLSYKYNELRGLSNDGSQKNLSLGLLSSFKLAIPFLKEEQGKIARFLDYLDQRIEKQEEKIEKLEQFKKGMMQKVFSQELRFKDEDGGEFEEWEERTLNSFVKVGKAGGTPLSSNRSYYNGEIPFLSIKDITNQGKFITNTEKYINEQGLKNSSAWVVPTNSLIYSMYASVGFVCINKLPISTSQAMYSMVLKDASSLEFLYYYLSYFRINGIKKFIETGTQGNLNANTVKNILVPSPSLKEQKKIGEFLSKIDMKIAGEKEKLMVLEEQKKGFMWGMFV